MANIITINARNTEVIQDTVVDETGAVYPLTGLLCFFIVKVDPEDNLPLIEVQAQNNDISSNIVIFRLTADNTNVSPDTYFFEVIIMDTELDSNFRRSVTTGSFIVKPSLDKDI